MIPQVADYLNNANRWRDELQTLRTILLDGGLTEQFKWRAPCYTIDGGNVAIIGELKDCCTLGFFKGVLLRDPQGLLAGPGANSRAARVIRFTSVEQIAEVEAALKFYIEQAIEVERAGLKVDFAQDRQLEIPEEFQQKLSDDPALQAAFEALTPGRQRGYLLFISAAKTAAGRRSRVAKHIPRILAGKGIHDCICGRSGKMPRCDGSHKSMH